MVKFQLYASRLIGGILVAVGLLAGMGWLLRIPALLLNVPDLHEVVLNSALSTVLMGIALLLPKDPTSSPPRPLGWTGRVGVTLIVLNAVILGRTLLPELGQLDWRGLHDWLHDDSLYPGRIAPHAAFGFAAFGAALCLMRFVCRQRSAVLLLAMGANFLVLALGLGGLLGYSIRPDHIYPELQAARMPLLTAISLTLASCGLFLRWYVDGVWSATHDDQSRQLRFLGVALLCVTALSTGVAALAIQQRVMEENLIHSLSADFSNREQLFDRLLEDAASHAAQIARGVRVDDVPLQDSERAESLAADLKRFAPTVSAMHVVSAKGATLLRIGELVREPEVAFNLSLHFHATLLWKDGLYLRSHIPLPSAANVAGAMVIVEQTLPVLTNQLFHTQGIGDTREISVCVDAVEELLCLPQRRNPAVYRTARRGTDNREYAMSHAVRGLKGVFSGVDYRGQQVLSIYGPLHPGGLGLVVKQDAAELYQPIRRQIELTLPLLLVLVALGSLGLNAGIKPLANRLVTSERAARDAAARIRTLVDNVGEGIITIDSNGTVETFNNAASVIFGYAPEEVIGRNIDMLIPAGLRARHHAGMQRYLAGGQARVVGTHGVQMTGLRRDGGESWIELTVNELRQESGDASESSGQPTHARRRFVGIVRDITERHIAEQALQAAHARLEARVQERTEELSVANSQLLAEVEERRRTESALRYTHHTLMRAQAIAHLGTWQLEHIQQLQPGFDCLKGRLIWSDELCRIAGLMPDANPAERDLRQTIALFHPDDRGALQDEIERIASHGGSYRLECRIVQPDGAIRHVISQGELMQDDSSPSLLLINVVLDVTEHKLAQMALRESEQQLRDLAAHLELVKEEERKRIAREIHDELGSMLTGIKSYLGFIIDSGARSGQPADKHLVDAFDMAEEAITTVRRVITDLRPSVLDHLGLWAALEWYAEQFEQRSGLRCMVRIAPYVAEQTLGAERSTAVFRIVQEALTNVIRHAAASEVRIDADQDGDTAVIRVIDDGKGIPPPSEYRRDAWGITGMHERARYFGGALDIMGKSGGGTELVLRMPLEMVHV